MPFTLGTNFLLEIGADNLFDSTFSGHAADVQMRSSALSAAVIKDIYDLKPTIPGQNLAVFNSTLITPGMMSVEDLNSANKVDNLMVRQMPACYVKMPPFKFNLVKFQEPENCEDAKVICESFGGRLPVFSETEADLKNLLMINQAKQFWVSDSSSTCKKAMFGMGSGQITESEGTDAEISFICLISTHVKFALKISNDERYYFSIVPHTQISFENEFYRIDVTPHNKLTLTYLKRDKKLEEMTIQSTKNIVGRHFWTNNSPHRFDDGFAVFSVCTYFKFTCSNGHCIDISKACDYEIDSSDGSDEEFCEAAMLPEGFYNNRLAPDSDEKTKVSLTITLKRVVKVNMDDNTVTLNLNVQTSWTDSRLEFKYLQKNVNRVLDTNIARQFWHPRIALAEAVTKDQKALFLNKNLGVVSALTKLTGNYKIINGYEG